MSAESDVRRRGGAAGLPDRRYPTFLFCIVFAYILLDGFDHDLGGEPVPMGNAIVT